MTATAPSPVDRIPAFAPPERLLAGPGPSNVDARVLDAMRRPLVSHLDPAFWDRLPLLAEMIGRVYGCSDGTALCLSASGTSGMEAGILNLVGPGDTVVAANAGFFGARIVDMLHRRGATVVEVTAPFGRHVPNADIIAAVEAHPGTTMVAVVYAETSTGVQHPLAELGAALRAAAPDTLLYADCVTALGGIDVRVDDWGVDYAYACSQKCLAAPPGLSPIALSARAVERLGRPDVPYSLDLAAHLRYWLDRPMTYHHTTPNLQYYALDEAIRLAREEGLEERIARHAAAGAHLQRGFQDRGFDLLADPACQLPQLTAVRVPDGVDGKAVQAALLRDHGIEVGGGLGPTAPPIWRIGMMGVNADPAIADRVLAAFDAVLPAGGQ